MNSIMKKISYILGLATALMAVSCAIEENQFEAPTSGKGYRISLTGETYPETKVSIGEKDGDKYPLLWSEGDVIAIYSTNLTTTPGTPVEGQEGPVEDVVTGNIKGEIAELYAGDAGKASGVFQTANEFALAADEDIIITYPGDAVKYTDGKISMTLPAVQEQKKANSSATVGNYALAYAKTTLKANQKEDVNFSLTQKTAFVKLNLTTSAYSNLKLVGAKLYCEDAVLAGKVECDANSGELTVTQPSNTVGATLREPVDFSAAQSLYFTALPCDLTGKDAYIIITMKDATSTVTIPAKIKGGKLEASCLTVININNISAQTNEFDWYEPVETRYIANFGNGWAYGPQNCFVAYYGGEAVTFDVKARGNFAKCKKPVSVLVLNACEQNVNNKNNLVINGTNAWDGSAYVKFPLGSDYKVSIQALAAGTYTGYSSKVLLLDENDKTIWCFNIWGNKEQLTEQTYINGVMLDRNIGSHIKSGSPYYQGGSYYQWGRPFQTGWSSSGGLFLGETSSVTDLSVSAAKPAVFMKSISGRAQGDWYLGNDAAGQGTRAERIDDLWGNQNLTGDEIVQTTGTKSIYDPCPKGYMVPSPKLLAELVNKMVPMNTNISLDNKYIDSTTGSKATINHMVYKLPDGTEAIWPYAGCKWEGGGNCDNNNLDICSCWSNSTITSYEQDGARAYLFTYRYREGKWSNQQANRAHGHAVRCMKDTENR